MREEKSPIRDNEMDNQEIDLLELAQKLWVERRLIFKWCAIGAVAALIIAFSIPKEYTTTIKLAPEVNDAKGGAGSLGSLAVDPTPFIPTSTPTSWLLCHLQQACSKCL